MSSTRVLSLSDSEAAQRSSQEMHKKDGKDEDKGESRGKLRHILLVFNILVAHWSGQPPKCVVSSGQRPFLLLDVHLGTSVLKRPWTDV